MRLFFCALFVTHWFFIGFFVIFWKKGAKGAMRAKSQFFNSLYMCEIYIYAYLYLYIFLFIYTRNISLFYLLRPFLKNRVNKIVKSITYKKGAIFFNCALFAPFLPWLRPFYFLLRPFAFLGILSKTNIDKLTINT